MSTDISSLGPLEIVKNEEAVDSKVTFEYVRSLDGLRAVAVLLVVLFHSSLILPGLEPFFKNGYLGVDVFFVLSGFLITSILLKEFDGTSDINFKNFYARRFLRLMPAYWLHLAVLFFFGYQLFTRSNAERLFANDNFLYALFYLTNWHRALNGEEVTGLLSHTWSLAIEEQFYILWAGLLFIFLRRMNRRTIVAATALLIAAGAMLRAAQWNGTGSVDLLYNAFNSRMDALLIGCLIAQLMAWKIIPSRALSSRYFDLVALVALFAAVSILFNIASYRSPFLYLGGFTLFAASVAVLIVWLVGRQGSMFHKALEGRAIVWIGQVSYGLYLWHAAAISIANELSLHPLAKFAAAMAMTAGITSVSYYFMEKQFLRLKQKFVHFKRTTAK